MKKLISALSIGAVLICITILLGVHVFKFIQKQDTASNMNLNGQILQKEKINIDGIYKEEIDAYKIIYISDGLKVTGFIFHPKDITKKYPVIIYNRGGNLEFSKIDSSKYEYLSFLAAKGYVILASQYRGNDGGEGKEEFGGKDINDVLNILSLGQKLPYVDIENIFMLGYSRGGMMTYIAIKDGAKIRAACVVGAPTDLIKGYTQEEQGMRKVLKTLIGGNPDEKRDEYIKRSAIYWPDKINIPILILHGENDDSVNVSQSKDIATKFDKLSKKFRLVIYPRGNHNLDNFRQERDNEILDWFEKYKK